MAMTMRTIEDRLQAKAEAKAKAEVDAVLHKLQGYYYASDQRVPVRWYDRIEQKEKSEQIEISVLVSAMYPILLVDTSNAFREALRKEFLEKVENLEEIIAEVADARAN